MNALESIKSELLQLQLGKDIQESWNILIKYFYNSAYFTNINQNIGFTVNGYVDPKEDDKHKCHIFSVKNEKILIKINVYDFRIAVVSKNKLQFNGYSLELIDNSDESKPVFKIAAA